MEISDDNFENMGLLKLELWQMNLKSSKVVVQELW